MTRGGKRKEGGMRRTLKHLAAALALTAAVALAGAQAMAAEPKRVTVSGEIVDTWCTVTQIMFAYGSAHYQCAVWCAIGGIPVSIEDEDGNIYVVLRVEGREGNVTDPAIVRIQARRATVEGDLVERDGVKYLLVSEVAADDAIVNLTHEDLGIQPFGK